MDNAENITDIFVSVAKRFNSIYYIDLVNNTFTAPAQTEEAARNYPNQGNYMQMIQTFAQTIVYPEDSRIYMEMLDLEHLKKSLGHKGFQEFEYRSLMPGGGYHWLRNQVVTGKMKDDKTPWMATLFTTDIHENKMKEFKSRQMLKEQSRLLEEQTELLKLQSEKLKLQNSQLLKEKEYFCLAMENSRKCLFEYNFLTGELEWISGKNGEENVVTTLDAVKDDCMVMNQHLYPAIIPIREALEKINKGQDRVTCEVKTFSKDGDISWIQVTLIREMDGASASAVGLLEDITSRKETECAYMREAQYRKSVQKDSLAIYEVNISGAYVERCILNNKNCMAPMAEENYASFILRFAAEKVADDNLQEFLHIFALKNVTKTCAEGKPNLMMDFKRKRERETWLRCDFRFYKDGLTKDWRGYLSLTDVSREKTQQQELLRRAERDSLTDIYNKGTAESMIRARISDLKEGETGTFFMIDMDGFKKINDTYGHFEGDRVIQDVADVLCSQFRKKDVVGRIGGDEFGIYFSGEMSESEIASRAESLCVKMQQAARPDIYPEEEITCSIGISQSYYGKKNFEQLYREADMALYHQKTYGKNGYSFYDHIREEKKQ